MEHDSRDRAIVPSVVTLAHSLGLTVVAEGIETDEVAALLCEMGVDIAQGYLYCHPLPVAGAARLAARPRRIAGRVWHDHRVTVPARPVSARPVLVVGVVSAGSAAAMAAVVSLDRWVLASILLVAPARVRDGLGVPPRHPGSRRRRRPSPAALLPRRTACCCPGHHVSLTTFATIVALAFLLALVQQIFRENRTRVTESLAATMAATVLAVAGGAYLTLRAGVDGERAARAALLGVAVVLGVGRVLDAVLPRPRLLGAGRRGWPGLVAGLAAATGVGALYGHYAADHTSKLILAAGSSITVGKSALIALVAALVAAAADLGIEVGLSTLKADPPRRRAPWPARLVVAAVLPILLAAPPAYVVARVVLS